ncbi:hypothetical protein H5410_014444 [Solanum commersonii]|uniref:F-box domain-containing protein n=1 Tax=Solanum commersonii TaxID=4109 RepID=A0A9J5ZRF0_SOLCO|nr:hypothetical protein H5410_014444 [Solanum commersonii]
MGQSSSAHGFSPTDSNYPHHRCSGTGHSQSEFFYPTLSEEDDFPISQPCENRDYTDGLPDECLALIFQSLSSGDRKRSSLVCRRWLLVEGISRHRLSLNAKTEIISDIPTIFSRFDSVTKLALRCDRRSVSINDEALILISHRCINLTRLKLRGCRDITDLGMACLAKNCEKLKKFSCGSCMFGAEGMNALLINSISLEELSVKRLRCMNHTVSVEPISIGSNAVCSLKYICLKELYNGQCFGPLIMGSKNLKTLKLLRCLGDWDRVLETIANAGVVDVARHCKLLRKVHIDGWRTNRIEGDLWVNLDVGEVDVEVVEVVDGSASDGGALEEGIEFPPIAKLFPSLVLVVSLILIPHRPVILVRSSASTSRIGILGGSGFRCLHFP